MPELPEVETVRLGLKSLIVGKTIKSVNSNWLKSFPNDPELVKKHLIKSKVGSIKRRGKALLINLSSDYSLIVHLKMTGQLVYRSTKENFGAGHPSDSLVGKLPDNSTRVILEFSDGSKLFFNDQRKFGWMQLIKTSELRNHNFLSSLGPEPLEPSFTWRVFEERLRLRPKSAIKAVLLDQTVLAGVGNIYADESLWAAQIHPLTPVYLLTEIQARNLHEALIEVLKLAIKEGGSSDRNYVNAEGKKGSYIKIAKVFRRQGQACLRCGREILKIRAAGRGTHYCPNCQVLRLATITKWLWL